jgi:hypothetical protein
VIAAPHNFLIVEDRTGRHGPELRGGALALWKYRGQECLLSGPSETGKTTAALHRLDALLWKYRGSQAVMVRKVRDTIFPTVLQTYTKKILSADSPVRPYGGERPAWFDYPNGSRLWLAGIDDPGKALSSERDFVYVNQAEELTEDDWQVLTTRATGRAANAPYGQVFGDCNPGPPHHWILRRAAEKQLRLFESRHEDNPTLHDGRNWTDRGRRTLAVLDGLTGVRKQRLRYGRWVAAEGQVYEGWDPAIHVIEPFKVPASWPRYWAIDFGFTNPTTVQWWTTDPDGRLYLYREIYRTGRLVEDHARHAVALSAHEPQPTAVIADHDGEGRATFERYARVTVRPAIKGNVVEGIQRVAARLRPAGDGRPRLFVMRGSLVERDPVLDAARKPTCLVEEMGAYVWKTTTTKGRPKDEEPVKENDHGEDAARYMVNWLDSPRLKFGNFG